jgi:hypothetical protein
MCFSIHCRMKQAAMATENTRCIISVKDIEHNRLQLILDILLNTGKEKKSKHPNVRIIMWGIYIICIRPKRLTASTWV